MSPEEMLERYRQALRSGAREEAQIWRTRYGISAGDFNDAFPGSKELLLTRRLSSSPGEPVGFLASLDGPDCDVVYPLKRGRNRMGYSASIGDYEQPRFAAFRDAQWIVVCRPEGIVVATYGRFETLVLPRACPRLRGAVDPRFEEGATYESIRAACSTGVVVLDREGDTVFNLEERDVLVTEQSSLVVGYFGAYFR
ncbi:MAG: hypothetical protein ABJE95_11055 [Byssovorax sp.]